MSSEDSLPASPSPQMPEAGAQDPMDALAAQLDLGFRAANETMLGTAAAWNAVFRAYMDSAEVARRALGGLLIDWHQRFLPRLDR